MQVLAQHSLLSQRGRPMPALYQSHLFGLVWILMCSEVKQVMLGPAQYEQQEQILKKHHEQDKVIKY